MGVGDGLFAGEVGVGDALFAGKLREIDALSTWRTGEGILMLGCFGRYGSGWRELVFLKMGLLA